MSDFQKPNHFTKIFYEEKERTGPSIFNHLSITVALFRSFTRFEQSLIIEMLSSSTCQFEDIVVSHSQPLNLLQRSLKNLKDGLGIIEETGEGTFQLNENFSRSLKNFLTSGMRAIFTINPKRLDKCLKDAKQFEKKLNFHAYQNWSNLHKYMLKSYMMTPNVKEIPENVRVTLETSKLLLTKDGDHSRTFDFLLDSIKNQVNTFLYEYSKFLFKIKYKYLLRNKNENEAVSEGSILNLILNLTLSVPCLSYSIKKSKENIKNFKIPESLVNDLLSDFEAVGLMIVKFNEDRTPAYFAVTPLLHHILSPNDALESQFKNNIIVETDFKLYAYSNNLEFLEALLGLFCTVKFKFPHMIVCSFEEEKVRESYKRGIKPIQILRYLNSNAHEKVIQKKTKMMEEEEKQHTEERFSFIPVNVTQQLILWTK